jgi:hypothetical protein
MVPMTPIQTLNRRRDPHRSDCWLIYLGDVHVGTIARAVGTAGAAERWVWFCGFYPGSKPGRANAWHRRHLRSGARTIRESMDGVSGETH